jgi:hypothetical protein
MLFNWISTIYLYLPFEFFGVFFYVLILFESGFHDHGKLPKKSAIVLCTLPKALSYRGKLSEKQQELFKEKSQFIAIVYIALAPAALRKGKHTTKP